MAGSSFSVAVKVSRYLQYNSEENRRLLDNNQIHRELGLLRRLEHPNLVPLIGVTSIIGPSLGVVFPWMLHGTLHSFLDKNKTFTIVERLKLVHGIGCGLEYLHLNDVCHGNLHSSNILIDEDQTPRISDFGLACTMEKVQPGLTYLQQLSSTNHPGLARWAAPEQLEGSKPHPSGDIYSFGCTMYEVFSGEVPWKDKTDIQVIALKLTTQALPSRPKRGTIRNEHWKLMVRCWSPRPQQRPRAGEVLVAVDTFIKGAERSGRSPHFTSFFF